MEVLRNVVKSFDMVHKNLSNLYEVESTKWTLMEISKLGLLDGDSPSFIINEMYVQGYREDGIKKVEKNIRDVLSGKKLRMRHTKPLLYLGAVLFGQDDSVTLRTFPNRHKE